MHAEQHSQRLAQHRSCVVVHMPCIPRLDDTYALRIVGDYAAQRHGVTALAILQPFIVELDMAATVAQLSVFLGL